MTETFIMKIILYHFDKNFAFFDKFNKNHYPIR